MNDQASSNNGIEKLIIIGSGPAAWTAAIYAARAELDPLVVEGLPKQNPSLVLPGGQLMLTTEVENYPGYPEGVDGPKMMEQFKDQATRFDTRVMSADVTRCDFGDWPFTLAAADSSANTSELQAHAVIIATGATANWLGLDNEQRLAMSGGGVSACAVCDGALPAFRDQHLVVVGGGDTAMEEALYLAKFASKVSIIHRRDQLRASKVMQERALGHERIEVVWNSVVTDVLGDEFITGVKLEDTQTGDGRELACGGMFVAIGHTPATAFVQDTGLDMDDKGYINLAEGFSSYTNIEGVFAAGDVADETYRQAVTAAGMGCRAAIDAERWLGKQGIGE